MVFVLGLMSVGLKSLILNLGNLQGHDFSILLGDRCWRGKLILVQDVVVSSLSVSSRGRWKVSDVGDSILPVSSRERWNMRTRTGVLVDFCALLIGLLGDPVFMLKLDVKLSSSDDTFTSFDAHIGFPFEGCLCRNSPSTCKTKVTTSESNSEFLYENITEDVALTASNKKVSYFVCLVIPPDIFNDEYAMSCTSKQSDSVPCSTGPCSVSINIICSQNKNVTIIWSSTQQARVYKSSDVTLINCCPITPTTPDQSSTTTSTTTTSNTTSSAIISTDTNLTTTSINPTTEVSSTESTIIPLFFWSSTTATESSNPTEAIQDQQNEAVTSQISGLHIGIIIGAVVAAILITILVMCVIWRIKTRSKSNPGNINQLNRSKHDSANQASTHRDEKKDSHKNQKSVALSNPPAVSNENEDEYSQISQDYNNIDIAQPTSNIDADRGLTVEPQQTTSYGTSLEHETIVGHSVYSHLRENKKKLDNPYNCATNEQIDLVNNLENVPYPAQGSNQEVDNNYIAPPTLNNTTNQKTNSDSGNKKSKPKETRPIPSYNYTEINHQSKERKHVLNNDQLTTGQETANEPPFSGNQIVQQATPYNACFELELSEPNIAATYENYLPNTDSTPVFSNAVYGSQEDIELNIAAPQEETTYANML